MLELEVFILELFAVDGFASSTITSSKVTALAHEVLDHSVEQRALVMQGLARVADTLFTGTQCAKVLGGLGNNIFELDHIKLFY